MIIDEELNELLQTIDNISAEPGHDAMHDAIYELKDGLKKLTLIVMEAVNDNSR